jgi:hypothetical protein
MSEEMRGGFAGVVERLKAEGQLTRNSGANSLKSLRDTLAGELSSLGEGLENVSNSIAESSTVTPPPAPQSAAQKEDEGKKQTLFNKILGTLGAIERGIAGGRDAVKDEKGFGKLLALFGAGFAGLPKALGPFVKLLKGGLILGAVYFALDAFEGILKLFEDFTWEGLADVLISIGTALLLVVAAFPLKTIALIKKLPAAFALMKTFFVTTLPSFFAKIKGSMLITKILNGISTAFLFMKTFFLTTLLPMLSGFLATLTPIIVAAAPFIAIGAAIAFAFFAVYKGIQAFIDKFKETGSIMDGLIAFGTTILTLPFTLIKDLISYIADLLGFENFSSMLDSIDFAASAFEFISGLVNDIVGFFTGLFDIDFGALVRKIPGAGAILDFLGFGKSGGDLVGEVERARESEERTKYAGALGRDRRTGVIVRQNQYDRSSGYLGAREQDQGRLMRRSEQQLRAKGLEVISPEERKMFEDKAAERTRKAEQALREYAAAPKLSDMIRNVTGKMSGVFSGVRDSVVGGFDAVVNIGSGIGESVKGAFNTVVDTVDNFIDEIGNTIFKFFGFPEFAFSDLVDDPMDFLNYYVIEPFTDFIDKIGNEIFKFFGFPEFFFSDLVDNPMEYLNYYVIEPITNLFNSIGNSITDFFNNMVDTVTNFILDIGQSILEFFFPDTSMVLSELSPMDFVRNFIIDPIKNFFTDVGQKFFDFFGIDALPLFISDVSPIEFFKGFILDPIKNFFVNALTTVGEFFQSIMDFDFLQFIKDNVPGAETALKIIGGIGSAVSSLFGSDEKDEEKTEGKTTTMMRGKKRIEVLLNDAQEEELKRLRLSRERANSKGQRRRIERDIGRIREKGRGAYLRAMNPDRKRLNLDKVEEIARRDMAANAVAAAIRGSGRGVKDMTDRLANAAMPNNSGDNAKSVNTTVNAPVNNISNSSATTVTSTPIVPGNMSLQAMRQASSA